MIESTRYSNYECGVRTDPDWQVLSYKVLAYKNGKLPGSGLSDTSLKGWLEKRRSLSDES
jgi:hypothetical protein